jgi:hypothetical protein
MSFMMRSGTSSPKRDLALASDFSEGLCGDPFVVSKPFFLEAIGLGPPGVE